MKKLYSIPALYGILGTSMILKPHVFSALSATPVNSGIIMCVLGVLLTGCIVMINDFA